MEVFYHRLYAWYEQNARILPWRETDDAYCIWLSEVILQQTRVAQGMAYYQRFVAQWPTVEQLAQAPEDEVMRMWQGLGYYSRARHLHEAARQVVEEFRLTHSPDECVRMPHTLEGLRRLPGVGDYTAGAIASFAYNLPYPALDGNVYRVLARLYDCDMAFDTPQGKRHFHALAQELLDKQHPRLFNSALMELGALHCVPQSEKEDGSRVCEECPVTDWCLGYAHHTVALLPVRKPRIKPKDREMVYMIYLNQNGKTLLHQRLEKDIWEKLYEFVEVTPAGVPHSAVLIWEGVHVLSHLKIHARFYLLRCESLPNIPDTIAVGWTQLDEYALSRLTLRALESHPI